MSLFLTEKHIKKAAALQKLIDREGSGAFATIQYCTDEHGEFLPRILPDDINYESCVDRFRNASLQLHHQMHTTLAENGWDPERDWDGNRLREYQRTKREDILEFMKRRVDVVVAYLTAVGDVDTDEKKLELKLLLMESSYAINTGPCGCGKSMEINEMLMNNGHTAYAFDLQERVSTKWPRAYKEIYTENRNWVLASGRQQLLEATKEGMREEHYNESSAKQTGMHRIARVPVNIVQAYARRAYALDKADESTDQFNHTKFLRSMNIFSTGTKGGMLLAKEYITTGDIHFAVIDEAHKFAGPEDLCSLSTDPDAKAKASHGLLYTVLSTSAFVFNTATPSDWMKEGFISPMRLLLTGETKVIKPFQIRSPTYGDLYRERQLCRLNIVAVTIDYTKATWESAGGLPVNFSGLINGDMVTILNNSPGVWYVLILSMLRFLKHHVHKDLPLYSAMIQTPSNPVTDLNLKNPEHKKKYDSISAKQRKEWEANAMRYPGTANNTVLQIYRDHPEEFKRDENDESWECFFVSSNSHYHQTPKYRSDVIESFKNCEFEILIGDAIVESGIDKPLNAITFPLKIPNMEETQSKACGIQFTMRCSRPIPPAPEPGTQDDHITSIARKRGCLFKLRELQKKFYTPGPDGRYPPQDAYVFCASYNQAVQGALREYMNDNNASEAMRTAPARIKEMVDSYCNAYSKIELSRPDELFATLSRSSAASSSVPAAQSTAVPSLEQQKEDAKQKAQDVAAKKLERQAQKAKKDAEVAAVAATAAAELAAAATSRAARKQKRDDTRAKEIDKTEIDDEVSFTGKDLKVYANIIDDTNALVIIVKDFTPSKDVQLVVECARGVDTNTNTPIEESMWQRRDQIKPVVASRDGSCILQCKYERSIKRVRVAYVPADKQYGTEDAVFHSMELGVVEAQVHKWLEQAKTDMLLKAVDPRGRGVRYEPPQEWNRCSSKKNWASSEFKSRLNSERGNAALYPAFIHAIANTDSEGRLEVAKHKNVCAAMDEDSDGQIGDLVVAYRKQFAKDADMRWVLEKGGLEARCKREIPHTANIPSSHIPEAVEIRALFSGEVREKYDAPSDVTQKWDITYSIEGILSQGDEGGFLKLKNIIDALRDKLMQDTGPVPTPAKKRTLVPMPALPEHRPVSSPHENDVEDLHQSLIQKKPRHSSTSVPSFYSSSAPSRQAMAKIHRPPLPLPVTVDEDAEVGGDMQPARHDPTPARLALEAEVADLADDLNVEPSAGRGAKRAARKDAVVEDAIVGEKEDTSDGDFVPEAEPAVESTSAAAEVAAPEQGQDPNALPKAKRKKTVVTGTKQIAIAKDTVAIVASPGTCVEPQSSIFSSMMAGDMQADHYQLNESAPGQIHMPRQPTSVAKSYVKGTAPFSSPYWNPPATSAPQPLGHADSRNDKIAKARKIDISHAVSLPSDAEKNAFAHFYANATAAFDRASDGTATSPLGVESIKQYRATVAKVAEEECLLRIIECLPSTLSEWDTHALPQMLSVYHGNVNSKGCEDKISHLKWVIKELTGGTVDMRTYMRSLIPAGMAIEKDRQPDNGWVPRAKK